ncbi:YndJ family transporter [Phytohabitans sp. ZYX-F-186]|uniref:YndJ family transporter n=1 Tax=Phytohabitans maris TaxID=3071409 RepID=A0ABU0ZRX7_9ACTN|nr:YndJ family transporter [Phytohabitans sp. ZYX-F-186]MDQ7909501.1 YndJ family transporter [Phytohabitans sp. ZYX-F-186]
MSAWSHALLGALICVGLLVVMPLGLRLVAAPGLTLVHRLWFAAAVPAAASVWLPRGWLAAVSAAAYLPAAAALLLSAGRVVGAGHGRLPGPRAVAVATALAAPSVAGCALVAERAGIRLFGFELDVLALTVAHFHYAGFAAALVAGLVCTVDGDGPAGRVAALCVPAGVAVVFAGFFTSEWVELAGAAVLTAGMWLVGWLTWRRARAGAATRGLLVTSALTLAATMVLALDWALGQAAGLPHLPVSWMVATHGLANALGFALCGLVAWRRLGVRAGWR